MKWSPEEVRALRDNYGTAESMEVLVEMFGRTETAINAKASELGLRRKPRYDAAIERLMAVLSSAPQSAREISECLGMSKSTTNAFLVRAHADGHCHISCYQKAKYGVDVAMWVAGASDHAENERVTRAVERAFKRSAKAIKPFRDPFTAAFFGAAR